MKQVDKSGTRCTTEFIPFGAPGEGICVHLIHHVLRHKKTGVIREFDEFVLTRVRPWVSNEPITRNGMIKKGNAEPIPYGPIKEMRGPIFEWLKKQKLVPYGLQVEEKINFLMAG